MSKITLQQIQEEIAADGWKVISEEYKNLDTEMEFECEEGHRVFAPWKRLRQRRECPICQKNSFKGNDIKVIPKKPGVKRTIGLDQATHLTGWSIIDGDKLVAFGAFQATAAEEIARDHQIKEWLYQLIKAWNPDVVGLEGIQLQDFSGKRAMGVTVYETLARLQGILMECCFECGITFILCHTAKWRSYCGVKGVSRADKKMSMKNLVKQWYDVTVTDDESDAIGIGKYAAHEFQKVGEIAFGI